MDTTFECICRPQFIYYILYTITEYIKSMFTCVLCPPSLSVHSGTPWTSDRDRRSASAWPVCSQWDRDLAASLCAVDCWSRSPPAGSYRSPSTAWRDNDIYNTPKTSTEIPSTSLVAIFSWNVWCSMMIGCLVWTSQMMTLHRVFRFWAYQLLG